MSSRGRVYLGCTSFGHFGVLGFTSMGGRVYPGVFLSVTMLGPGPAGCSTSLLARVGTCACGWALFPPPAPPFTFHLPLPFPIPSSPFPLPYPPPPPLPSLLPRPSSPPPLPPLLTLLTPSLLPSPQPYTLLFPFPCPHLPPPGSSLALSSRHPGSTCPQPCTRTSPTRPSYGPSMLLLRQTLGREEALARRMPAPGCPLARYCWIRGPMP